MCYLQVPLDDVAVVVACHQELVQGSPQYGRHLGPRTGDGDAKDGCGLCQNRDNRYEKFEKLNAIIGQSNLPTTKLRTKYYIKSMPFGQK